MDTLLASVGLLVGTLALITSYAQLRRTPKPKREPEPFTPTSITILNVPMDSPRDLLGTRRP